MGRIKMLSNNEITLREGYTEYLLDCKARNLRDGTIRHYTDSFRQISKYIDENTFVSQITKTDFDKFIIDLRDNPNINDMSLYSYSRDFKTLLYFFMKKGFMPTYKISIPKSDKQPIETYTDKELSILLKKPNVNKCSFTEYKTWVMTNFLLSSGVRQNSLINIKIKDVDFEAEVVRIDTTKNRKPLIIPLNEDILAILKEYLKYRKGNDEDYLFCNAYGDKLVKSTLYHIFYEYNKRRGVEKTGIHRYRHTFAKKWVMLGGNVVSLQKILGHSSLAITQNYLNLLVSDLKKDVDKTNILREFKRNSIQMK